MRIKILISILIFSFFTLDTVFSIDNRYSNNMSSKLLTTNDENVCYIIEDNYDLHGEKLMIPKGCILDFRGGTISNGTLVGNGSTIVAPLTRIFSTNLFLDGYWQNDYLPVEWYGAIGDNSTNSTTAINAAIGNTTFKVISLVAGGKYVIDHSIKMRSSELSFGCFQVAYSHEDSPAAYIYSNCAEHILEFPSNKTVKGINLKGIVLHKRYGFYYKGDGIHIDNASFYRSVFEGVRIYYCNNGFYENFDKDYHGFSLNKFQNCVFSGCRYGFHLNHDKDEQFSYWVNLNSWDNCHFGFNLECGLWIENVYSCEQNLFTSCSFEGVSMDENTLWDNDTDISGIKLSGQGYGLTTFMNCYFERNHPKSYKTKPSSRLNESSQFCVADVIVKGLFASFENCTFNDGITPFIIRDGRVGITIRNTIFRIGYDSDYLVLFKNVSQSNLSQGNYFIFDVPYIEKRYQGKLIKTIECDITGLAHKLNYLTVN